jgi:tryptophan-rich sensory protein
MALAGWLLVSFGAAALGALASADAGEFYAALERPAWAPPGWLFAPVWTLLYALMGVAAWLAWRRAGFAVAHWLFLAQLAVNALWTWLFFAWRQGALAFVEILVLWALVAATAIAFRRIRPLAGLLLVPYLAWVTFAAALTYAVWRRNPTLL